MRILVDADACPVKEIIIKIAKQKSIPVIMFADTSHYINDGYSSVITVDRHNDSADYEITAAAAAADIVVTQDYGLAAMVMAPNITVMNQDGFLYTDENIDMLLESRHNASKIRRSGGKTTNQKKRRYEDDEKFENLLNKIIQEKLK